MLLSRQRCRYQLPLNTSSQRSSSAFVQNDLSACHLHITSPTSSVSDSEQSSVPGLNFTSQERTRNTNLVPYRHVVQSLFMLRYLQHIRWHAHRRDSGHCSASTSAWDGAMRGPRQFRPYEGIPLRCGIPHILVRHPWRGTSGTQDVSRWPRHSPVGPCWRADFVQYGVPTCRK
jgi:hypothetical protein